MTTTEHIDIAHVFRELKASYKITDRTTINPDKSVNRAFYAEAMQVIQNEGQANPLYQPMSIGGMNVVSDPSENGNEAVENLARKLIDLTGVSPVPVDKSTLALIEKIEKAKKATERTKGSPNKN